MPLNHEIVLQPCKTLFAKNSLSRVHEGTLCIRYLCLNTEYLSVFLSGFLLHIQDGNFKIYNYIKHHYSCARTIYMKYLDAKGVISTRAA